MVNLSEAIDVLQKFSLQFRSTGCSPQDSSGILLSTNNVFRTEFVANDIADTLELRLDLSTISTVYPGASITTSHSNGKSRLFIDIATTPQSNPDNLKSAVLVIEKNDTYKTASQ